MYTFLLQDWITMRAMSAITVINQNEAGWLDLSGFQDFVAWADVKGITSGGGTGAPVLTYQTSPSKDDTLFTIPAEGGAGLLGVNITPVIQSSSSTVTPLARWLRWQMQNTGQTSTWDMTFRIFVSANAGGGRRKSLGGVATAPSMRAGVPPSPGTPGSIRTRSGSSASSGGSGGASTGASSGAGTSSSVPYVHTPPSTPLHLQSSPGSLQTGMAGGSGGSVPRMTPGSSGAHGPVRPTGPSVPLHRKPRGPTR